MRMTVDEAAAIEAEADAYPDERGEILLEAAAAWRAAGQPERANKLLTELVEAGGDDGCYARVDLAEACFADGTPDEAFEHLAALAGDPALEHSHAGLAAELLAELGHAEESLRWYDRAVARLTPEELRALSGPQGWAHMSAVTVRGRREVRRGLGLPADATDDIVPDAPLSGRGLTTHDQVRHQVAVGRRPQEVRMLVFQRAERARAKATWPEEYAGPDDEHFAEVERRWRALVDSGVPSVKIVAGTVAGLCEYAERVSGDPRDEAVKAGYIEAVAPAVAVAWPPGRNAPCWCGSGAKYKKCCGRSGQ